MRTTLLIALRNLRRRPLRTILTGSTVFVGTVAVVLSVGLVEGTYRDMIGMGTRTFSGHFQVVAGDYQKKARKLLIEICKLPYLNAINQLNLKTESSTKRLKLKLRLNQE